MQEKVIGIVKNINEETTENGDKIGCVVIDYNGNDLDVIFYSTAWRTFQKSLMSKIKVEKT